MAKQGWIGCMAIAVVCSWLAPIAAQTTKTRRLTVQEYQRASNGGIDVKINGAYVLMGLLFGKRDPVQTTVISCRCGQDSDCNPSSSAGVLFTTIGFSNLPARFDAGLDETAIFSQASNASPRAGS